MSIKADTATSPNRQRCFNNEPNTKGKNMFLFRFSYQQIAQLPIETYNNQLLKIYGLRKVDFNYNFQKLNYVTVNNIDDLNNDSIAGIPAIIIENEEDSLWYNRLKIDYSIVFRQNKNYALIHIKKCYKENENRDALSTSFYLAKNITLIRNFNFLFLRYCQRKKIMTLTDKEYFKIPHIPMEYIPCRYAFNSEFKNFDNYKEEIENYSETELVKKFNNELKKTHDKYREVRLVAYDYVFSKRFKKSPITRIDNNVIILNNKVAYLKELDTILCYPQIN